MDTKQKLAALRALMKEQGLAGYLQPVHDEYMNEYPPACARRVEWISGFSGSAGTAAILADKAAIFVDGRYTLQAETQVDGALFERHNIADMMPEAWLARHVADGRVGYDPKLYTQTAVKRMEQKAKLSTSANLVDAIWKDRPAAPATPLFIHEMKYSGAESSAKRRRIAESIKAAGADLAVIAAPDAVCWLFNVRAHDVENSPLALCTALVDEEGKAQLFVAKSRCGDDVRKHLGDEVELREPSALEENLKALGKAKKRVLADARAVPVWFTKTLADAGAIVVEGDDPCLLPKAIKNPVELQGMKNAHIRDGLAVTKLLCWLDRETAKREVMEMEVCDKLLGFRAENPLFREASFNTISGSGPHGAVVHYRATAESNRALKKGELFLLDSGGQYPDGTTDITRTVAMGTPSTEHRDRFTRVLKGHIAIARAVFPTGTAGSALDALARQYLWQAGLDYDHGTGHGVGCFLNVHEGPQRISKRGGDAALVAGMVVSNEPGYYKAGEYGIRIENLVAVVAKQKFLGFESLTCAPIDTRLVDAGMLSPEEKDWLNAYHAWVEKSLSAGLTGDEHQWLKAQCAPV